MWTPGLTPNPVLAATLLLVAASGFSTLFSTDSAIAQTVPGDRPSFSILPARPNVLFENLTLTPNQVATTVRGISGGPLAAAQVAERAETATGPCIGFVDTQPDHVLTLTEPFNGLSLQVQSAEDTTLVIKGPGGSWCNDSYTSANPGIAGQWLPGTYDVWVGSHRSTGFFPYIIRIFEIDPPPGLPPVPTVPPATEPEGTSTLPDASPPSAPDDAAPSDLPTSSESDLPDELPNP
jgi:hypothetical protein